jgi:hypothetical protein
MGLPVRRDHRSTLSRLDDALLVGVVVVGVLLALQVVSWVVGAFMFGLKVAIAVAIGYVVLRLVNRSDRR